MTNTSTNVNIQLGSIADIGIPMSVDCSVVYETPSTSFNILTDDVSLSTSFNIAGNVSVSPQQVSTVAYCLSANVDNCCIRAIYKQKPSSSISTYMQGYPHRACTTVVNIQNGVKNHV